MSVPDYTPSNDILMKNKRDLGHIHKAKAYFIPIL